MSAVSGKDVHLSFSTQPWSEFVGMTSKLEFTVIDDIEHGTLKTILESDVKETTFDKLVIEEPDSKIASIMRHETGFKTFKFYSHGLLVCFAFVDKIFYNKPKDEYPEG